MSYENYTLEDFLTDREFKNWVLNPDNNSQLFWGKWIETHPEQEEIILKARELILSYRFKEPEALSEVEQEKILEGILEKRSPKKLCSKLHFLRYVAAVSLLIISSLFTTLFFIDQSTETIAMIVKQNPPGQKSTIKLPDGTRVWLNSESRITYPEKFINERTVELTGEAFFEVAKDPEKPFKVSANGLVTTALGTSFNIKAYLEMQEVQVKLITGKVSVESFNDNLNLQEKLVMAPGEQVIYNTKSHLLEKSLFDEKKILWKEGIISFQKAGFDQIKRELDRWYGVTIEVENLDREIHYTADFDNENLERVLERMAFTEKFTYKIHNDTIKINFH